MACRTCDMIRGLLLAQGVSTPIVETIDETVLQPAIAEVETKVKRKVKTVYQRAYKKAFNKISKRYKLKSGKWMKNGFKKAVKAAHAEARRRTK